MNKKLRKLAAKEEFKKPVTKFEQIDLSKSKFIPSGMTRAYRNTRYTVMVYDNSPVTTGTAIRVMIQRHDDKPIDRHWSEMQKIKNQIFGSETTAVEYYPAQSNLIDDHNIYWFWIFPDGVLPIPSSSKNATTKIPLPLTNQQLWEMAKTITDKQKEASKLTEPVDWGSLEEDWFDWLEESIFGNKD